MAIKENVLTRTDDFIKWFLPKIEKFPRNYKFLFGDRLVEIQFDLLENLIEADYQKEKLANLRGPGGSGWRPRMPVGAASSFSHA